MVTFSDWIDDVKIAYLGRAPSRVLLLMVVKDGVSAIMARDVESDLPLAKSYQDRFERARTRLAGSRLTGTAAEIIAEIRPLLPIAADTVATSAALDHAIEVIADDINALADKWDAFVIEAAIELQRHVPFYCVRQMVSYLKGGDGVTDDAFVSRITLPVDARVQQVWYGHYYPPIEDGVELAAGDIVVSNGRLYKVITGGTPVAYDVSDGLHNTDCEEETLGDLTFVFYRGTRDHPVRALNWAQRQSLASGQFCAGPAYVMAEQQDVIWLYPALDDTHRFDVEYVGIAQSFQALDIVTFDKIAAKAAAHYAKGMMQQTEENDARGAAASLSIYQRTIREAELDCQDRKAGPVVSVVPYDWTRNPRVYGSATQPGTTAYPNGYAHRTNTTGDITLESTAANMVIEIDVLGIARSTKAIIRTEDRHAGDLLTVVLNLPSVEDISFDFVNGTEFGLSILPETTFPSQLFTSLDSDKSARFDFSFNGLEWEFVNWASPA